MFCYLVIKCSEAREHPAVSAAAQPHYLSGRSAGCGSVQDPCQVGYGKNGDLSLDHRVVAYGTPFYSAV